MLILVLKVIVSVVLGVALVVNMVLTDNVKGSDFFSWVIYILTIALLWIG